MTKLGVNIDHIATLRQARGTLYPDPVQAAYEAELGGADLITAHLREDRRHIQARDLELLKEVLQIPLNMEMAITDDMVDTALKIRPSDCCLVPERREELTTEGGLDVAGQLERVKNACQRLGEAGIRVSLFVDPDPFQLEAAAETGAPVVEIHTGRFADAKDRRRQQDEFAMIESAAALAQSLSLQVNAGHGLHYHNVRQIITIPGIQELNIGHAIIARALLVGMRQAVRDMRERLQPERAL